MKRDKLTAVPPHMIEPPPDGNTKKDTLAPSQDFPVIKKRDTSEKVLVLDTGKAPEHCSVK